MVYVALLRGINVGGNNKIPMAQLKTVFERAGMQAVKTYINSGNVVFAHDTLEASTLAQLLEAAIETEFAFRPKVLVRDAPGLLAVAEALPNDWKNDDEAKCDVMFLGEAIDRPEILDELTIKPEMDRVIYTPGAVLWWVARKNVTRSGLLKIVGTETYRQMTVRNCNTLRKLAQLVREAEAAS
jgi:uncharacterized protein (DUF1697 family)